MQMDAKECEGGMDAIVGMKGAERGDGGRTERGKDLCVCVLCVCASAVYICTG